MLACTTTPPSPSSIRRDKATCAPTESTRPFKHSTWQSPCPTTMVSPPPTTPTWSSSLSLPSSWSKQGKKKKRRPYTNPYLEEARREPSLHYNLQRSYRLLSERGSNQYNNGNDYDDDDDVDDDELYQSGSTRGSMIWFQERRATWQQAKERWQQQQQQQQGRRTELDADDKDQDKDLNRPSPPPLIQTVPPATDYMEPVPMLTSSLSDDQHHHYHHTAGLLQPGGVYSPTASRGADAAWLAHVHQSIDEDDDGPVNKINRIHFDQIMTQSGTATTTTDNDDGDDGFVVQPTLSRLAMQDELDHEVPTTPSAQLQNFLGATIGNNDDDKVVYHVPTKSSNVNIGSSGSAALHPVPSSPDWPQVSNAVCPFHATEDPATMSMPALTATTSASTTTTMPSLVTTPHSFTLAPGESVSSSLITVSSTPELSMKPLLLSVTDATALSTITTDPESIPSLSIIAAGQPFNDDDKDKADSFVLQPRKSPSTAPCNSIAATTTLPTPSLEKSQIDTTMSVSVATTIGFEVPQKQQQHSWPSTDVKSTSAPAVVGRSAAPANSTHDTNVASMDINSTTATLTTHQSMTPTTFGMASAGWNSINNNPSFSFGFPMSDAMRVSNGDEDAEEDDSSDDDEESSSTETDSDDQEDYGDDYNSEDDGEDDRDDDDEEEEEGEEDYDQGKDNDGQASEEADAGVAIQSSEVQKDPSSAGLIQQEESHRGPTVNANSLTSLSRSNNTTCSPAVLSCPPFSTTTTISGVSPVVLPSSNPTPPSTLSPLGSSPTMVFAFARTVTSLPAPSSTTFFSSSPMATSTIMTSSTTTSTLKTLHPTTTQAAVEPIVEIGASEKQELGFAHEEKDKGGVIIAAEEKTTDLISSTTITESIALVRDKDVQLSSLDTSMTSKATTTTTFETTRAVMDQHEASYSNGCAIAEGVSANDNDDIIIEAQRFQIKPSTAHKDDGGVKDIPVSDNDTTGLAANHNDDDDDNARVDLVPLSLGTSAHEGTQLDNFTAENGIADASKASAEDALIAQAIDKTIELKSAEPSAKGTTRESENDSQAHSLLSSSDEVFDATCMPSMADGHDTSSGETNTPIHDAPLISCKDFASAEEDNAKECIIQEQQQSHTRPVSQTVPALEEVHMDWLITMKDIVGGLQGSAKKYVPEESPDVDGQAVRNSNSIVQMQGMNRTNKEEGTSVNKDRSMRATGTLTADDAVTLEALVGEQGDVSVIEGQSESVRVQEKKSRKPETQHSSSVKIESNRTPLDTPAGITRAVTPDLTLSEPTNPSMTATKDSLSSITSPSIKIAQKPQKQLSATTRGVTHAKADVEDDGDHGEDCLLWDLVTSIEQRDGPNAVVVVRTQQQQEDRTRSSESKERPRQTRPSRARLEAKFGALYDEWTKLSPRPKNLRR